MGEYVQAWKMVELTKKRMDNLGINEPSIVMMYEMFRSFTTTINHSANPGTVNTTEDMRTAIEHFINQRRHIFPQMEPLLRWISEHYSTLAPIFNHFISGKPLSDICRDPVLSAACDNIQESMDLSNAITSLKSVVNSTIPVEHPAQSSLSSLEIMQTSKTKAFMSDDRQHTRSWLNSTKEIIDPNHILCHAARYQIAIDAQMNGDYDDALDFYTDILVLRPSSSPLSMQ